MFLMLGLGIMFLPNLFWAGGTKFPRPATSPLKSEKWRRWLSGLAFLQSCLFVAVAFACEAAGTHWLVGAFCVLASLSCSALVLCLNGLKLEHFVSSHLGD